MAGNEKPKCFQKKYQLIQKSSRKLRKNEWIVARKPPPNAYNTQIITVLSPDFTYPHYSKYQVN